MAEGVDFLYRNQEMWGVQTLEIFGTTFFLGLDSH
jgi:hypothetical protein